MSDDRLLGQIVAGERPGDTVIRLAGRLADSSIDGEELESWVDWLADFGQRLNECDIAYTTLLRSGKPECPAPDRYRGCCCECSAMLEVSCREWHQTTLELPPPTGVSQRIEKQQRFVQESRRGTGRNLPTGESH